MMVVPVLMTSCHVSDQWKNGPDTAQTSTIRMETTKVDALPACWAVRLARREKIPFMIAPRRAAVARRRVRSPHLGVPHRCNPTASIRFGWPRDGLDGCPVRHAHHPLRAANA